MKGRNLDRFVPGLAGPLLYQIFRQVINDAVRGGVADPQHPEAVGYFVDSLLLCGCELLP